MRRAIFCTSLVLIALGLFGCGSGGSGSSTRTNAAIPAPGNQAQTGTSRPGAGKKTTTTAPAGSSYAARADAVCTRYQQQRRAIFSQVAGAFRQRQQGQGQRGGANPGDIRQKAVSAYHQAAASGRRELAELRALRPPPGQAATARAYFASVSAVLDDLDRIANTLAAHGARAVARGGGRLPRDAGRSHQLARELGMNVCGQLR